MFDYIIILSCLYNFIREAHASELHLGQDFDFLLVFVFVKHCFGRTLLLMKVVECQYGGEKANPSYYFVFNYCVYLELDLT